MYIVGGKALMEFGKNSLSKEFEKISDKPLLPKSLSTILSFENICKEDVLILTIVSQ